MLLQLDYILCLLNVSVGKCQLKKGHPSGQQQLDTALKFLTALMWQYSVTSHIPSIRYRRNVFCSTIHITANLQQIWAKNKLQYLLTIANIGKELCVYFFAKMCPLMRFWCLVGIVSAPQVIQISQIMCIYIL